MSKSIFFIAGEHSGDALGGRLMAAMKARDVDVQFSGVGGPDMAAQGLSSFVPMDDLCVMGLVEVLKHYPRLKNLGMQIIAEIERVQPDVVVTIDLPDFNFRVAKLLKKRGVFKGKIIHYVAPTVWAWRPGRAKKIAQFLDGLMCLFPFEPEYFTTHGLRAEFVGHSLVESGIGQGDGARFRVGDGMRHVGLYLGSRQREVDAHLDVFVGALEGLEAIHVIVPTFERFRAQIEARLERSGLSYTLSTDANDKWNAMAACDAAVAVSGTVGLELAYTGVPHVIGYRVSFMTWVLLKMLVRVKYAHLANILLDRAVVPEFLQGNCEVGEIKVALKDLLLAPEKQQEHLKQVRAFLQDSKGLQPSEKAADFINRAC